MNKINFIKKISGRRGHRYLMQESFRIYSQQGYNVKTEVRMPNNMIVDVLATKKNKKIAIECFVRFYLNNIKRKQKLKEYVDELVIAYPQNFIPTFPLENYVDKSLPILVPEGIIQKMTTITINPETWSQLVQFRKSPDDTFDNVIQRLIDIAKEQSNE